MSASVTTQMATLMKLQEVEHELKLLKESTEIQGFSVEVWM
jgi:hypothetical protein